jgi:hypothetical protein
LRGKWTPDYRTTDLVPQTSDRRPHLFNLGPFSLSLRCLKPGG